MNKIKIFLKDTAHDYFSSIVPILIRKLGYTIEWTSMSYADLVIQGPFIKSSIKPYRWLPKPLRPFASNMAEKYSHKSNSNPLYLFQTSENIRPDTVKADFYLSFDLGISDIRHHRFPYWMEMVDWSSEGVTGNLNPRYGELLSLERLMQPLGNHFLDRPWKAAMITSHLFEPRGTLFNKLSQIMPTDGFGPYFDRSLKNHSESGFEKCETLKKYAINLCPENGLYPGYYTEKIPEAFQAGCLPVTWTDTNVQADFNPKAFINLEPMAYENYEPLKELLQNKNQLKEYAEQPLLLQRPSIELLKAFLLEICRQATS